MAHARPADIAVRDLCDAGAGGERGQLYEHLLRRNERLVGAHFVIGIEDAVFLRGELPDVVLTEAELDRILGTLYATVEQCFRGLLRIGFASRIVDLTRSASPTSPHTGSCPGGSLSGKSEAPQVRPDVT